MRRLIFGAGILESALSASPGNAVLQRPSLLEKAIANIAFSGDDATAETGVSGDLTTAILCVPIASATSARSKLPNLVQGSQTILMSETDDAACFIVFDTEEMLKVYVISLLCVLHLN